MSESHLNPPAHSILNTEQFTATNKANVEALTSLTTKAFEGVEQLTALNIQVVKASLDEVVVTSRAMLSTKDPQSLLTLQTSLFQRAVHKANAYGKQAYGIIASVGADVDKVTGEQAAALQGAFVSLVEATGKNAPEGSSNGIALFKSAIETANNAFAGLQKAGCQTAETAETVEANFAAVSDSAVKVATKGKRG